MKAMVEHITRCTETAQTRPRPWRPLASNNISYQVLYSIKP